MNKLSGNIPEALRSIGNLQELYLCIIAEYGEGSVVSTAGDIYSLGILLLEMFTGRRPTEGTFRDSLDLHKFVEDALPNRTFEIADPTMWLKFTGEDGAEREASTREIQNIIE